MTQRSAVGVVDVARRAGVSVGTVSNALNRPELVAPATRERVLRAARELGLVRNASARQLRAGRSQLIGLVVLDLGNPFFTDLARGADDRAQECGYAVVLGSSDQRPDKEHRYLALMEEQRMHGVLVTPTDAAEDQLRGLQSRGTPVVVVDRAADPKDACSVTVDDVDGGRQVMVHLRARGHRRVAFVGGPFTLPQVRHRYAGFTAAADAATVTCVETDAPTAAAGRQAGESLATLPSRRRPTAVFCANDIVALGVLQAFVAAGLGVPDDVAIVGYDDIDLAAAAAVPLSSVRQPRTELGRTGIDLLLAEADPGHTHRRVTFRPELVVRASSGRTLRHRTPSGGRPS